MLPMRDETKHAEPLHLELDDVADADLGRIKHDVLVLGHGVRPGERVDLLRIRARRWAGHFVAKRQNSSCKNRT